MSQHTHSTAKRSFLSTKIQTLLPDPAKQGVNINLAKYTQIKEAIQRILLERGEITFKDLTPAVEEVLRSSFEGSISWYVTTVKLDLEARSLIERIPNARPQRLRMVDPSRHKWVPEGGQVYQSLYQS